ncbi:MAG: DUF1385 domain-containing protein [Actinobacteria bacterium]|nr:MAG: DUF1385 domain-containing protein [Actinomycetota bacterium]
MGVLAGLPAKKPNLGGQAVIEGVMMRGPKHWVVSCRRHDGSIVSQERQLPTISRNPTLAKTPILRGVIALYDSLSLALRAFSFSAQQAGDEEVQLSKTEMSVTMLIALVAALALFVVAPAMITNLFTAYLPGRFLWNIVDGLFRIAIFFAYIAAVSRMRDVQRVFQYHGAEHKSIHAYEEDKELIVDNIRPYTTAHLRCGTSFLLWVMIVAILVFSVLPRTGILLRILIRLVAVPVIAGLSYEVLKVTAKFERSPIVRLVTWPGMMLQRMTTREPDDSQIEVAIDSLGRLMRLEGLGEAAQPATADEVT